MAKTLKNKGKYIAYERESCISDGNVIVKTDPESEVEAYKTPIRRCPEKAGQKLKTKVSNSCMNGTKHLP